MHEECGHSHEHEHNHEHSHLHDINSVKDEKLALLAYMLNHNEHHAKELMELSDALYEQGKNASAKLIEEAVLNFNQGNEKLAKALESAKEE